MTIQAKRETLWVRKAAYLLALASSASCGAVATAQTPSAPPASEETGQPDSDSQEIIVNAQRRAERLIEVPISVQVQTGEELVKAGITDGRLLEQASPALSFQSGYAIQATSFSIRGVSSLAAEGGLQPSVGIVVDNMPLARQGEVLLDLADIQQIEVLSGPQGTLFGKNSTAGVVNIISKRPGPNTEAFAEASYTTDDEALVKAAINVPLSSGVAARINGYYHRISPLAENTVNKDVLGMRSYGAAGKLLFGVDSPTNFLITGTYNHNYNTLGALFVIEDLGGPLGAKQQDVNPFIGYGMHKVAQDTLSYQRTNSWSIIGEFNSDLSDNLHLVAITGYRHLKWRDDIDVDAGPTGGVIGAGISSPAVGPLPGSYPLGWYGYKDDHEGSYYKYWSQEVRLNYSVSGLDVVAGAFYQDFKEFRYLRNPFLFDGTFVGAPAGLTFLNQTDTFSGIKDKTFALFGDVTAELTDTVKVFGGLRYNHEKVSEKYDRQVYFNLASPPFFDPVTGVITAPPISTLSFGYDDAKDTTNNLSGRVGLKWQPNRDTNLYASYNRGYKGPAVNRTTGVIDAASAIVKPETADAFEIGAKLRFMDGKLGLDLALYSQKIKNIQQASIRPGTIIADLINAGSLKTDGFEVNFNARPIEGLNFDLGVVYNDARYAGNVVFNCGPTQLENGTCPDNPSAGFQNIDGKLAVTVPKWKVVSTVDYERPIGNALNLLVRASYEWRSGIQDTLFEDPRTFRPHRGQLDASIGLAGDDDRWQVTLFGRNLTNSFYYASLNTVTVIGRSYGIVPRDYHRYGGIRLTYKM